MQVAAYLGCTLPLDVSSKTWICENVCMHTSKRTLAGRVYNHHSSTLLAFLHIDLTIRHQIA